MMRHPVANTLSHLVVAESLSRGGVARRRFGFDFVAVACAVVACCLLSASATAQELQSDTLNVRVESSSSSAIGRLKVLSNDKVTVEDEFGKLTEFVRDDVFAVTFVKPLLAPPTSEPWLVLASGDFLRLSPTRIDDASVTAKSRAFDRIPPFKVPLEFCRAITWTQSSDPVRQAVELRTLLERKDASDLVQLRNGDRIEGEFVELADDQIGIETAIGASKLPVAQVRCLVFNPGLVSQPKPIGSSILMTTTDGSTWKLSSLVLENESLKAESLSGFKFELPITTLVDLRFQSDRFVALSALVPSKQVVDKFLASSRSPRMNLNVLGGRLVVGRRPFGVGIGCASGSTIEWSLPKNSKSFRTSVGLDRAADGKGSVRFEVLVDGESKWLSERITGQTPLIDVPAIDVSGAKLLTLKTHFDDFGHVLDYANWCNPLLTISE